MKPIMLWSVNSKVRIFRMNLKYYGVKDNEMGHECTRGKHKRQIIRPSTNNGLIILYLRSEIQPID